MTQWAKQTAILIALAIGFYFGYAFIMTLNILLTISTLTN